MSVEWLFSAIVFTCLMIITIVVIFGGIIAVRDETYTFNEYLTDLSSLWKILLGALIGTFGRAFMPVLAKLGEASKGEK